MKTGEVVEARRGISQGLKVVWMGVWEEGGKNRTIFVYGMKLIFLPWATPHVIQQEQRIF